MYNLCTILVCLGVDRHFCERQAQSLSVVARRKLSLGRGLNGRFILSSEDHELPLPIYDLIQCSSAGQTGHSFITASSADLCFVEKRKIIGSV